jgi:hypothetical protein
MPTEISVSFFSMNFIWAVDQYYHSAKRPVISTAIFRGFLQSLHEDWYTWTQAMTTNHIIQKTLYKGFSFKIGVEELVSIEDSSSEAVAVKLSGHESSQNTINVPSAGERAIESGKCEINFISQANRKPLYGRSSLLYLINHVPLRSNSACSGYVLFW